MAIKVHDVVCVTDTDNNEEWLGYCAGFTTKSELNKECEIVHFPYILVTRDYGMGRDTVSVPPHFCS